MIQSIIKKELVRELSFMPRIEAILNESTVHIRDAGFQIFDLKKADAEDDMKNGFDFLLTTNGLKIPVRIRKPRCRFRDFTIRSKQRNGGRTEIHKIYEGAGDIYFYAWTIQDGSEEAIEEYWLIDLHKFRNSGLIEKAKKQTDNGDGTMFLNYTLSDLEAHGCIIRREFFLLEP